MITFYCIIETCAVAQYCILLYFTAVYLKNMCLRYHFSSMTSVIFYSLFYLAKSCLHWVRKCGMNQTCLRTAELKLIRVCSPGVLSPYGVTVSHFSNLKTFNFVTGSFLLLFQMGHLAFSRLYYHNMTQDLKVNVLF